MEEYIWHFIYYIFDIFISYLGFQYFQNKDYRRPFHPFQFRLLDKYTIVGSQAPYNSAFHCPSEDNSYDILFSISLIWYIIFHFERYRSSLRQFQNVSLLKDTYSHFFWKCLGQASFSGLPVPWLGTFHSAHFHFDYEISLHFLSSRIIRFILPVCFAFHCFLLTVSSVDIFIVLVWSLSYFQRAIWYFPDT